MPTQPLPDPDRPATPTQESSEPPDFEQLPDNVLVFKSGAEEKTLRRQMRSQEQLLEVFARERTEYLILLGRALLAVGIRVEWYSAVDKRSDGVFICFRLPENPVMRRVLRADFEMLGGPSAFTEGKPGTAPPSSVNRSIGAFDPGEYIRKIVDEQLAASRELLGVCGEFLPHLPEDRKDAVSDAMIGLGLALGPPKKPS